MQSREPVLFVIGRLLTPYAGTESQLLKLLEEISSPDYEPMLRLSS